jgi:hypothetical protein
MPADNPACRPARSKRRRRRAAAHRADHVPAGLRAAGLASASVSAPVEASLGLHFAPAAGEIRCERPMLPGFLNHLHVRGLRRGEAEAEILLQRFAGEVAATVTERRRGARRRHALNAPISAGAGRGPRRRKRPAAVTG